MSRLLWIVVLMASSLLIACGSTPETRYYYLKAPQLEGPTKSLSGSLGLGPVETVAYIDRPHLTTSEGNSQLQLASYDQWAEPLDSAITRVLVQVLDARLDSPVYRFPWRSDMQPRFAVRVQIDKLDRDDGQAILQAGWSLVDLSGELEPSQHSSSLSVATGSSSYASLAEAYSELLARLAEQIIASVPGK